jgi:redox-sensitive bicupin YhaK (pirin superfamily)
MNRDVLRIVTAHRQLEGGGFVVRRPLPTAGLELVDPFLLVDEMGPVDLGPGEAKGAPDHPHRGFETVTYVLAGEMEHEDSAGNKGKLRAGDVQWMTAGEGVVHSEEPSRRMREQGGRMHGFQIWVNLPRAHKLTAPRYQEIEGARIPTARTDDGKAHVKVVAGEALGARAVVETFTPIVYQDWTLEAGGDVTLPLDGKYRAMVYVFEGALQLGDEGKHVVDGQLAILGRGDAVRLRAQGHGRALLLAGVPLDEPVARWGPFVMNTREEIVQAVDDFQSGRFARIAR